MVKNNFQKTDGYVVWLFTRTPKTRLEENFISKREAKKFAKRMKKERGFNYRIKKRKLIRYLGKWIQPKNLLLHRDRFAFG